MFTTLIAAVDPRQTADEPTADEPTTDKPTAERTHAAALERGQTGTIERVDGRVHDRALAMGIRPGRELELRSKQPFRGPLVVAVDRSVTSISRRCARGIELSTE